MVLLSAVCRHRYTKHCNSAADPGCLSQMPGLECFSVPDPESNKKEGSDKTVSFFILDCGLPLCMVPYVLFLVLLIVFSDGEHRSIQRT
jgi:hypothetical protein